MYSHIHVYFRLRVLRLVTRKYPFNFQQVCAVIESMPGDIVHYNDVIMGAMASQITSLTIVYSSVLFGRRSRKTSKLRVTGLCEGNSPVTGELPTQMASNAEDVSLWWRHHGGQNFILRPSPETSFTNIVPNHQFVWKLNNTTDISMD